LCERHWGKFIRSFRLPVPIEEKKIDASFKDGVLIMTLPKREEVKPKEIEINMN
jgi:HSP20 family protein